MTEKPIGLVLAGGLAQRMGGHDKASLRIGEGTILDRVLACLRPQCAAVLINANGDPARFAASGCTIVPDTVGDHLGPLAGLLAGMDWIATHQSQAETVLSVSGDCPFLPGDLAARLDEARRTAHAPIAHAQSGEWRHPTIGLWPVALRHDLRHTLEQENLRKVEVWAARHGVALAHWADRPRDPFFNVNTPEDLEIARQLAGALA